jgi:urea transporter
MATAPDPAASRTPGVDPVELVRVALRGVGQVMFQEHAGTGLLFLAGIAVASPLLAVGAVAGAVIGPAVAYAAGLDRKQNTSGIYGFNATLVGIATLFYLRPEPMTWALVAVGCAASTFVTWAMRRFLPFPTYTAPFILTTWLLLVAAHAAAGTAIDVKPAPIDRTPVGLVDEVLRGTAEVMFGANGITGLLFLAGIALSDWRHAVLAVLGSTVGTLLAIYHDDPADAISIGIYGYNAALSAIAIFLWRRSLLLPILAALASVPLTEFFPKSLGVPPLTAPFVAASWAVIAVGWVEGQFLRDWSSPRVASR